MMQIDTSSLLGQLAGAQNPQARRAVLERHLAGMGAQAGEQLAKELKTAADQALGADIAQTLSLASSLQTLSEITANRAHQALGLLAEANARSIGMGEHRKGIELYDRAAEIYSSLDQPIQQAASQVGKIGALLFLGEYQQALEAGEWAGQVLGQAERWLPLAKMTGNLGIVYHRLGDDPNALEQFERAQLLYNKLGLQDGPGWLRAELNRALILRNLGRFDESIEASNNAASRLDELGLTTDAARARQSLALTYFVLGKFNDSQVILDKVREVFLAGGRMPDAVLAELFISDCLLELRRFKDVLEVCQRVRTYFTRLGTRFEAALAILNESIAYAGLTRYDKALDSLAEARGFFRQEGNTNWARYCDLEIAGVLLKLEDFQNSLEVARECIAAFEREPVRQAHARLIAATALFRLGQIPAARETVQTALAAGPMRDLPTISYAGHHLLGRISQELGDMDRALMEYEQAIEDLELVRGRMMVEYRSGYLEEKGVLYEDLVALCVERDQPRLGLSYAERAKSRALLDLLAHRLDLSLHARVPADQQLVDELKSLQARRDRLYRRMESQAKEELHERSWSNLQEEGEQAYGAVLAIEKRITDLWHKLLVRNADYAREASLWQVRTEPVQPHVPEGTLLLEYYTAHGVLYVFTVNRDRVRVTRLDAGLGEVQNLIQLLWHNLRVIPRISPEQIPSLTGNAIGVLGQLYQALLAPLQADLAASSRLIVVPHGPLHYLPFHALHDGGGYLIQRFEFSYLPGASFLRYLRPNGVAAEGMLVGAHSYGGQLPHTQLEAEKIAGLWGARPLLEAETTLERFTAAAPSSRAIHLATHGDFRPDNPLFSGLALADGWLTTLNIFNMRLNASLVTLSACETGRNVVGGGDELLGLMRAFLTAGAASLALSLWAVEDSSTALLMEVFYRGLKEGQTKGQALRSAQTMLLRGGAGHDETLSRAYQHPYFWAPFILVGHAGEF